MNAQVNENVMTNNEAILPAPYFWYDHTKELIIGKELNFKKSGNPGSAQEKALLFAKEQHPTYKYYIIKSKKEKNSYKGLKRELMYDYIDCFGSEDMMEKFQQMKEDGTAFGTMKSWFLELFPKFNVETGKKEIQKHRSGKVKAKYKVVKFAPKSNSKPGSNIAELPKASGNN